MFVSLSRTIGKVGGFRIGIGTRLNKKNQWWLCLIVCVVALFQLAWYSCILVFWLIYALGYGMWWCCKKIAQGISNLINRNKKKVAVYDAPQKNETYVQSQITSDPQVSQPAVKYCPNCGSKVTEGSLFCGNCGGKL